jgi:ketosteroid isomerase-like protein
MILTKYPGSFILFSLLLFSISACKTPRPFTQRDLEPSDAALYQTILELDEKYFTAYNTCDMETQAEMYNEDLEFYHDQGGFVSSKATILQSIQDNICGKVTRTLVEGSVEVYPIKGYGAVEIGYHTFFNNQEPNARQKPVKFITIWKQTDERWTISRVVSLH